MTLTENKIVTLGFELNKEYEHGGDDHDEQFYTRQYRKGLITVEFTFLTESKALEDVTLVIDETILTQITAGELGQLDKIINKK